MADNDSLQKRLGLRIRQLRESKGWTGRKLSRVAEVNASTLLEYENGEHEHISIFNVQKLANALNTSVHVLLNEDKNYIEKVRKEYELLSFQSKALPTKYLSILNQSMRAFLHLKNISDLNQEYNNSVNSAEFELSVFDD
ncbi:helix-turn-helix transcriptional regulator [Marivirga tractuosa]|uniref:helix-turn-helix domain-containing protein n=1 Tax=Marivirga tractuosa TaxID=1006 RepID=UPI0035D0B5CF